MRFVLVLSKEAEKESKNKTGHRYGTLPRSDIAAPSADGAYDHNT
jgi:hypothetical protein